MKKILSVILVALILLPILAACDSPEPSPAPADTTPSQEVTTTAPQDETTPAQDTSAVVDDNVLEILNGEKSAFKIIRSENSSKAVTQSVSNIFKEIVAATESTFVLGTDWVKNGGEKVETDAPEILIGHTNRAETAQVLSSLPANSYTVTIVNGKLVIVGTDDNLTVLALYDFAEKILENPNICAKNKFTINRTDCFSVTCESTITLPDIIRRKLPYAISDQLVVTCKGVDQYKVGQGAASDGTFAYFALRNSNDTGSVICKYRLDDGTFVANSEVLDLGHANDMTYDAAKKQLVVAHGQSEGKILTIVDPDTLAYIKDVNITHGAGAITYSVGRGSYAISQGGSTLHMLTAELKYTKSYSRITGTGYTAQGMGSDESYIYFPMSGSKDNILQVYDWSGNYATTITIPISMESESMFWVNDTYYVAFIKSGNEYLHRLDFTIIYE